MTDGEHGGKLQFFQHSGHAGRHTGQRQAGKVAGALGEAMPGEIRGNHRESLRKLRQQIAE